VLLGRASSFYTNWNQESCTASFRCNRLQRAIGIHTWSGMDPASSALAEINAPTDCSVVFVVRVKAKYDVNR
jgi:hypothetical protein